MKAHAKHKALDPLSLVKGIVQRHQEGSAHIRLRLAIWLNPSNDALHLYRNGVELVEVCDGIGYDSQPDFRATRFSPPFGEPGVELTLTSPEDINLDLELSGRASFYHKLKSKLGAGKAVVVFSESNLQGVNALDDVLGPVEVH